MDYKRIYDNLIERSRNRKFDGYSENHHIIPRSLGGNDDKSNLVKLTAREHFICHYLLTKIYPPKTKEFYSMIKAFMSMCWYKSDNQERYVNSHLYHKLREQFSEAQRYYQTGVKNSQFGTKWIHNKELKINKKIQKDVELEDGWELGRIWNFEKTEQQLKNKKIEQEYREKIKQEHYNKNKDYYFNLHEIYITDGWDIMIKKTGYNKTQANFVQQCKYYLDNFIPQSGKKRC